VGSAKREALFLFADMADLCIRDLPMKRKRVI